MKVICLKINKLLSYFNEPIEVKELVYKGDNSEIYLDRIQGDDRSFINDSDKTITLHDKDNNLVEKNALWLSEIYENEDFIISIKKDALNKVKYPLTVKISNFNIINYEEKY